MRLWGLLPTSRLAVPNPAYFRTVDLAGVGRFGQPCGVFSTRRGTPLGDAVKYGKIAFGDVSARPRPLNPGRSEISQAWNLLQEQASADSSSFKDIGPDHARPVKRTVAS